MKIKVSKKAIVLIAAAALLIALAVGGTVAFLQAQTTPVENTFIPGKVVPNVRMTETGNIESIKVENVENIPAYFRVAIVGNVLDPFGNVVGNLPESFYDEFFAGAGWSTSENDPYYYYDTAVQPNESTGELLKEGKEIPLDSILVTVLAEAIQADGMGASSAQQAFQIAKGGA